ncbi:hypothetical protein [Actinokineospora pegani]|uniref:hypothetical protein n=1 Tax=Actinokineospora pegani TaxID=2654637 RepID=UPI0018D3C331|nr:hypothetical protein [Actinokineospora pegani]
MSTPDADTMAELIADCADLPSGLATTQTTTLTMVVPASRWDVSDAAAAQVTELDEYV